MRIDASGNVGIGMTPNTNYSRELNIKGQSTNSRIKLSNTTTGSANTDGFDILTDGNGAYVWQRENDILVFATNNDEKVRVDASGRVLIGTTTEGSVGADQLTVSSSSNTGITIRAGTSSSSAVYFSDGTSGTAEYDGYIAYSHSARTMYQFAGVNYGLNIDGVNKTIRVTDGGTQKLRISDNGINFGTDTTAATALDDYEEGTWTPSFVGLSNTPVNVANIGRYTKIGNLVHVQFNYQSGGTSPAFSSNTAELKVSGLPFASTGGYYVAGVGAVASQTFNFQGSNNNQGLNGDLVVSAIAGSNIVFKVITNGSNRSNVRNSSITGGAILETSLTYRTT